MILISTALKFSERIFFIIVLLLTLFVRIKYANIAFERDEGEYAYAGLQILRGALPYADFYNMKLPGVYYFYAFIIKLFGASAIAIRLTLLFINLFSTFFIFKIAERFKGGWIAASVFLLLSLSYEGQGMIANSEHFVVLFFTAGFFFTTNKGYLNVLFGGFLLAASLIMKQHAAFFALIALFYIFKNDFTKDNLKPFLFKTLSLLVGYAIPLSIVGIWAYQKGILSKAYFLTFEYAAAYSSIFNPSLKYISNFKFIFIDNIGLWLLFFTTIYCILNSKKWASFQLSDEKRSIGYNLAIGFGLSFLAVCPGWHFRPHYFQLIFPFAALLVAYGWVNFKYKIEFKNFKLSGNRLLIACFLITIIAQFSYFFIDNQDALMRKLYPKEFFNETRAISEMIKSESQTNDKIGIYGNEPQVWFYTQKQAGSGFIYAYPLVETQPFAERMTDLYIHEMETVHPHWLIYSNISKGESNKITLERLERWFQGFSREYNIRGVLYQKMDAIGSIEWNITAIDSTRKPLMVIYKRAPKS